MGGVLKDSNSLWKVIAWIRSVNPIVGRRRNSPVGIGNAFRRGSGSAIGGAIPATLRPALSAIAVKVRTLFEHRGRPPSGPLYIADV